MLYVFVFWQQYLKIKIIYKVFYPTLNVFLVIFEKFKPGNSNYIKTYLHTKKKKKKKLRK